MTERIPLLIDRALSAAAGGAYDLAGLGWRHGQTVNRWCLAKLDDRRWFRSIRAHGELVKAFNDLKATPWDATGELPTTPPIHAVEMEPRLPLEHDWADDSVDALDRDTRSHLRPVPPKDAA